MWNFLQKFTGPALAFIAGIVLLLCAIVGQIPIPHDHVALESTLQDVGVAALGIVLAGGAGFYSYLASNERALLEQ